MSEPEMPSADWDGPIHWLDDEDPYRTCPRCNGAGWQEWDEEPCDTCYGEGEILR